MNAGEVLTPLERTITLTDMVAYAGATWDWHPLHYDPSFLASKGLDRPVVDGQVLGALMAEQVRAAAGPRAFITALSFRFKAMVFAGDTVRVEATVTEVADGYAAITQTVHAGGKVAAEGAARVRL